MSQARKGILQKLGLPHHEFWPWWVLLVPIWPLWIWYGLRLGSLTWFTTVNPGIEDGGFMGESKMKIMDIIPEDLKPKTIFISVNETLKVQEVLKQLPLPFIAKPDIGGRGRKIKIVWEERELLDYHQEVGEDYMVQEIIEFPLELGVFYSRIPSEEAGQILSIASKSFLKVVGNGILSIRELMSKDKRAIGQVNRLAETMDLDKIPAINEEILLEPIGNHAKGTVFINENKRISNDMAKTFDKISKEIGGFYYGRFDLRVTNWEDLELGKNISILELNGLTSDPAHIFDPNYRLRDVFKTQYRHINQAYEIAKYNLKHGVKPTPLFDLFSKTKAALKDM